MTETKNLAERMSERTKPHSDPETGRLYLKVTVAIDELIDTDGNKTYHAATVENHYPPGYFGVNGRRADDPFLALQIWLNHMRGDLRKSRREEPRPVALIDVLHEEAVKAGDKQDTCVDKRGYGYTITDFLSLDSERHCHACGAKEATT